MHELYRLVHVDTPLAPYFSECITSVHLDDMNIEIMINTLYKAYLEDVYQFFQITANRWESGLFILFLVVFAIIVAGYVLKRYKAQLGVENRHLFTSDNAYVNMENEEEPFLEQLSVVEKTVPCFTFLHPQLQVIAILYTRAGGCR
ncbi:unnamed protein product [Lactuca saligna]|uniref:Uncharacterized protein n=1 Tax=Lactuca saligna TaxID=75948 RepID=A0AA36EHF1_LACSI|nr:unnamed protein product [Lactuca saligna]